MKNKLEYAAFVLMGAILQSMPLRYAATFSGWMWRWLAPFTKRHKRAHEHLAMAMPQLSPYAREGILKAMWANLGRVTAEGFHLKSILADDQSFDVPHEVWEVLENLKANKQGAVFVSLHMGNWELVSWPATKAGLSMMGIYQRARNELVNNALLNMRSPIYKGGLFDKGHHAVRQALSHVRSGGTIGLLADLRDARGIHVPFFGKPAPTNTFPALLALRCDAPLYAAATVRVRGEKTSLKYIFAPIPYKNTGHLENDVAAITTAIQKQFEIWVTQYPEQWMWAHRRWG